MCQCRKQGQCRHTRISAPLARSHPTVTRNYIAIAVWSIPSSAITSLCWKCSNIVPACCWDIISGGNASQLCSLSHTFRFSVSHVFCVSSAPCLICSTAYLHVSSVLRLICSLSRLISVSHLFCDLSVPCLICSESHLFRVSSLFDSHQFQAPSPDRTPTPGLPDRAPTSRNASASSHVSESVMRNKGRDKRQLE